jgi:hypothetical protein
MPLNAQVHAATLRTSWRVIMMPRAYKRRFEFNSSVDNLHVHWPWQPRLLIQIDSNGINRSMRPNWDLCADVRIHDE